MSTVKSYVKAIFAVLTCLPLLLSALVQTLTSFGYGEKDEQAIVENFLEGNEDFLDEAVAGQWSVGFGRNVLTPEDIDTYGYFIAGYLKFPAQEVTAVIDDICVRAVVLDDNSGRGAAAFAWVDCVGLMNNDIKAIREKLADITGDGQLISIDVGATHTHTGVDTQGLWGNIPKSGRDQKYMDRVIEKTADAIRTAYEQRTQGTLYYSALSCPEMFRDTRDPQSFDDKVHLLRFMPSDNGKKEIFIANFGAHPVNLGWGGSELSGDFVYHIEQAINERYGADFAFIQGAIGGGIEINRSAENGITQDASDYEKLKEYSAKMAGILDTLVQSGETVDPILNVRHTQVEFELNSFLFKLVERAGLCNAQAYKQDGKILLTSEIGYVEIGKNIKVLEVPGEVMPEIVYGNFCSAEEAYNGTEYPHAALNTHFAESDEVLVFGLCNDALGYFVPDNDYSASNEEGHYEETVSTGSGSASALSAAFEAFLGIWG